MAENPPILPGRSTFAKVAVLVCAGGAIACALLSLRQARLQAFHETAASQLRLQRHEERVFQYRALIAHEIMPEQVRRMAGGLWPVRPLGFPADSGTPGGGMAVADGQRGRTLRTEETRP